MADQSNVKIIKNFKRRATSTRKQLHQFVKAMCDDAYGDEIESILLDKGFAACIAREWGTEHLRRRHMLKLNVERKFRKETSPFGKRGQECRRINATVIRDDGRRLEFHATKGPRLYAAVRP